MTSTPKILKNLPGCYDHLHADWLIGPVGVHRDSDLIAQSNWEVVTEAYREADPDQVDHEIHRFRHWAVGWIEEVAYRPGSAVVALADKFRAILEDSPIISEDHYSNLESEAVDDNSETILEEIRGDLRKIYRTWSEWTDENDDTLDDLAAEVIWNAARDLGEYTGDGWIKYSKSDLETIAVKLQSHFGYK